MKRFKVAVVGCGSMAHTWVKYASSRQDAEIVALVDINTENARAMAKRHSLSCPVYQDLGQAISASGANLVMDVAIPAAHHHITNTALSMGCDVLGEKPMAATMAEARDMVKQAEKHGRTFAVMQNRRYNRRIRAYRDLVDRAIGQPGFVCADFFLGPHFGGFRDAMESPLILDMAIHTFDQARFISGADPVSVYCHEFNPPGSWYQGNAAAVCIFELSNGAIFCYRGSWCAEGAPTSWESAWRVTGSKGTAIWDADRLFAEAVPPEAEKTFVRKPLRVEPAFVWEGQDGHFGCLDEMFGALLEGRKPETDCSDNIKSMAMVFGALESAKQGRKVLIADL